MTLEKDEILKKLKSRKINFSQLPIAMQEDKNVAILALKAGYDLSEINPTLWNNLEVACEAVKKVYWKKHIALISQEIQDTPEFLLASLKNVTLPKWKNLPEELKNSVEFFQKAVQIKPQIYVLASELVKNNKSVVLIAVRKDAQALNYMLEHFKSDIDVVLMAIKKNPNGLVFASEALKDNKDIVMSAVKTKGQLLEFASKRLQADEEVILKAIKGNPKALYYASSELRDKEHIIEAAMVNNFTSIMYASDRLKNDLHFMFKICQKNMGSFNYCGQELKARLGHTNEPLILMKQLIEIQKEKTILEKSIHPIENKRKMKI